MTSGAHLVGCDHGYRLRATCVLLGAAALKEPARRRRQASGSCARPRRPADQGASTRYGDTCSMEAGPACGHDPGERALSCAGRSVRAHQMTRLLALLLPGFGGAVSRRLVLHRPRGVGTRRRGSRSSDERRVRRGGAGCRLDRHERGLVRPGQRPVGRGGRGRARGRGVLVLGVHAEQSAPGAPACAGCGTPPARCGAGRHR